MDLSLINYDKFEISDEGGLKVLLNAQLLNLEVRKSNLEHQIETYQNLSEETIQKYELTENEIQSLSDEIYKDDLTEERVHLKRLENEINFFTLDDESSYEIRKLEQNKFKIGESIRNYEGKVREYNENLNKLQNSHSQNISNLDEEKFKIQEKIGKQDIKILNCEESEKTSENIIQEIKENLELLKLQFETCKVEHTEVLLKYLENYRMINEYANKKEFRDKEKGYQNFRLSSFESIQKLYKINNSELIKILSIKIGELESHKKEANKQLFDLKKIIKDSNENSKYDLYKKIMKELEIYFCNLEIEKVKQEKKNYTQENEILESDQFIQSKEANIYDCISNFEGLQRNYEENINFLLIQLEEQIKIILNEEARLYSEELQKEEHINKKVINEFKKNYYTNILLDTSSKNLEDFSILEQKILNSKIEKYKGLINGLNLKKNEIENKIYELFEKTKEKFENLKKNKFHQEKKVDELMLKRYDLFSKLEISYNLLITLRTNQIFLQNYTHLNFELEEINAKIKFVKEKM